MCPVVVVGIKDAFMAPENFLWGSNLVKIRALGKWASPSLSSDAQPMRRDDVILGSWPSGSSFSFTPLCASFRSPFGSMFFWGVCFKMVKWVTALFVPVLCVSSDVRMPHPNAQPLKNPHLAVLQQQKSWTSLFFFSCTLLAECTKGNTFKWQLPKICACSKGNWYF